MGQDQSRVVTAAAAEIEDMITTLNDLDLRSRNLIENKRFTLEDVQLLSRYITDARVLLAELTHKQGGRYSGVPLPAALVHVTKAYWELEGIVKEARNSLSRKNREMTLEKTSSLPEE